MIIRHALLWGLSLTVIPGLIGGLPAEPPPAAARARDRSGNGTDRARRSRPQTAGVGARRRSRSARRHRQSHARRNRTSDRRSQRRLRQHRARPAHAADAAARAAVPVAAGRRWCRRASGRRSISCIAEVDALLDRFRALLRISELEDLRRRSGFDRSISARSLRQVHELYAPLAEDNAIAFRLDVAFAHDRARRSASAVRGFQQSRRQRDQVHAGERQRLPCAPRSKRAARASMCSTADPAFRAASAKRCCSVSIAANAAREPAAQGYGLGLSIVVGHRALARLRAAHRRQRNGRHARERVVLGRSDAAAALTVARASAAHRRFRAHGAVTPSRRNECAIRRIESRARDEIFFIFAALACTPRGTYLGALHHLLPGSAHEWNCPHRAAAVPTRSSCWRC